MSAKISGIRICVIGLGYVGLPLAVEFGKKFNTVGFDINSSRIKSLCEGIDQTLELTANEIAESTFLEFTEDLKDAIVEDITANLNADPRIATEEILVSEADKGIAIQATITYVPLNITEKLRFNFDENSLLRLS